MPKVVKRLRGLSSLQNHAQFAQRSVVLHICQILKVQPGMMALTRVQEVVLSNLSLSDAARRHLRTEWYGQHLRARSQILQRASGHEAQSAALRRVAVLRDGPYRRPDSSANGDAF